MAGPIAFIADIHGNIWALDAVLADVRRRGIGMVFNLGDSVYGPLEPALTADRLIRSNIPSLRGNQDRVLLEPLPSRPHPTLAFTMSGLLPRHTEWLQNQPCNIEYRHVFMCHGTPSSDEIYLTEAVNSTGVWMRCTQEIERLTESVVQSLVCCGHSHVPRVIGLPGGKVIINPGSVGLPAYSDGVPFPHRMETGSPHARYAIEDGGRIDLIAVAYDHDAAAARARENGREDWAVALETGYAAR